MVLQVIMILIFFWLIGVGIVLALAIPIALVCALLLKNFSSKAISTIIPMLIVAPLIWFAFEYVVNGPGPCPEVSYSINCGDDPVMWEFVFLFAGVAVGGWALSFQLCRKAIERWRK